MLSRKIKSFNSPIKGRGLVAQENIAQGEWVVKFEGERISVTEANKLYASGFDYMLQISPDTFLLLEEDSKFVNHSCEPNAAFLFENGELVALRDIRAGEEITFDYSLNENTPFQMKCECGHKSCRGQIGPWSEINPSDQEGLKAKLSPHIKQLT